MLGFGEAMIDIVTDASKFEGMSPEGLLRSIKALISTGLQLAPVGSVKCKPLSVRTVWVL
jgi:hypothetical protein